MESDYAGEYRQNADHFVLGRRMQLFIMQSFYRHFLADRKPFDVLDLGCGDGELAANFADVAPHARLTLVDGSADMLAAAQERFREQPNVEQDVQIMQHTFAELIADPSTAGSIRYGCLRLCHPSSLPGGKDRPFRRIYRSSETRWRVCQHRHRLSQH